MAVFARDRKTGARTQLKAEAGCVQNDGFEGCADGRATVVLDVAIFGT